MKKNKNRLRQWEKDIHNDMKKNNLKEKIEDIILSITPNSAWEAKLFHKATSKILSTIKKEILKNRPKDEKIGCKKASYMCKDCEDNKIHNQALKEYDNHINKTLGG